MALSAQHTLRFIAGEVANALFGTKSHAAG